VAPITQKIRKEYRSAGVWRLLQALLNRIKILFSRYVYLHKRGRFLEWDLTRPVPEVEHPRIDIEIRELKEDELSRFKEIVREPKLELFRRRLSEGKVCLVAWHGDEVAWFGWVTMSSEYEPVFAVTVDLKKSEGYVLDAFTNPKYRKKNLHSYMSARRLDQLQKMGATKAYGIAALENLPSRRAHNKGGCVETKEISYINILGMRFHRWKDLRKK